MKNATRRLRPACLERANEINIEQDGTMNAWSWAIVGVAAFLALSFLVAFGVAAILGRISRELSELLEPESWASAPLTRERRDEEQEAAAAAQALDQVKVEQA